MFKGETPDGSVLFKCACMHAVGDSAAYLRPAIRYHISFHTHFHTI